MTYQRLLFLLGGGSAFDIAAEEFVPAAGEADATIALLLASGKGLEEYLPDYTQPWIRRGVSRYSLIFPGQGGTFALDAVSSKLREATGIFIGGGHTPTYHHLYATEPIRSILQERYHKGIPIAGCSAGALIAPEICALPSDETEDASLKIVDGLGLVSDLVVGVHFTERNSLPELLKAMIKSETRTGWGIDEPACAVFEDGEFKRVLGGVVYEITVTDFEIGAYTITEHAASHGEGSIFDALTGRLS